MIKGNNQEYTPEKITTKQKILICATNLFSEQGYTETTIREIAAAVGLRDSSIYNHFPSKSSILEYILEDYTLHISSAILDHTSMLSILRKNPTPDGILECIRLTFPAGQEGYYQKILCVMMQEQHRNPIVRSFVSDKIILRKEQDVKTVIEILKELHIIHQDTDYRFWTSVTSSLFYTFANRIMMGIGNSSTGYSGICTEDLLRYLFAVLLKTSGINKSIE